MKFHGANSLLIQAIEEVGLLNINQGSPRLEDHSPSFFGYGIVDSYMFIYKLVSVGLGFLDHLYRWRALS